MVLVALSAAVTASTAVSSKPGQRVQSVLNALEAHLAPRTHLGTSPKARFAMAFVDLNGDHRAEAIVYLVDDSWCGSGGCMTFVFTPSSSGWKWVSSTTLTKLPIYRLRSKHHGWNDLGVSVRSDYVKGGLVALHFNGSTYKSYPTIAPVKFSPAQADLLISDDYNKLHEVQGVR